MCKLHIYQCQEHDLMIERVLKLCSEGKQGRLCINSDITQQSVYTGTRYIIRTSYNTSMILDDIIHTVAYYTKCKECKTNSSKTTKSNEKYKQIYSSTDEYDISPSESNYTNNTSISSKSKSTGNKLLLTNKSGK